MESNWRYNIWEYGMTYSDWELCARVITPFGVFLIVRKAVNDPTTYWYQVPALGQVPVLYTTTTYPGRFPWGVPVFPDH